MILHVNWKCIIRYLINSHGFNEIIALSMTDKELHEYIVKKHRFRAIKECETGKLVVNSIGYHLYWDTRLVGAMYITSTFDYTNGIYDRSLTKIKRTIRHNGLYEWDTKPQKPRYTVSY